MRLRRARRTGYSVTKKEQRWRVREITVGEDGLRLVVPISASRVAEFDAPCRVRMDVDIVRDDIYILRIALSHQIRQDCADDGCHPADDYGYERRRYLGNINRHTSKR